MFSYKSFPKIIFIFALAVFCFGSFSYVVSAPPKFDASNPTCKNSPDECPSGYICTDQKICAYSYRGGEIDVEFTSYAGQTSAELICSVTNLISQTLLPPIAVLMALVVGFLFLTSQGEPQKISLATKVLLATLVGVFLLLVAPGIIALINDLFGSNITAPSCDPAVTTNTIITALLNLVNLFAWFSAVVAVAMGLYSGFLYLTARGNPQQARQATMVFSYTIIGIAVSVVAFGIITIVEQFIRYP